MNPHTRLRILTLAPVINVLIGAEIGCLALLLRAYVPPAFGLVVSGSVVAGGAIAIRQLWRASPLAPIGLAVSGAITLCALLSLDRVIPLVNASSEPPSVFQRYWYPATFAFIVLLTGSTSLLARASLRRTT